MEKSLKTKIYVAVIISGLTLGALFIYAFYFSPGKLVVTSEYPDIYLKIDGERLDFDKEGLTDMVRLEKNIKPGNHTLAAYDEYTNILVFSEDFTVKSQRKTNINVLPNQENKDLLLEGD